MTTNPTSLLKLSRPLFNSSTWHDDVNNNMVILDAALRSIGVYSDIRGIWLNSTAYVEGDKVVDSVTESLWRCETAHTSRASGTLAQDVAAHPTYWRPVSQGLLPRGAWTTATDYFVNDLVYAYNGTVVLGCLVEHTSGDLETDIASGIWFVIFDISDVIGDLYSGFRNKMINGDFLIWQRGTSFASPASGVLTCDRWYDFYDGAGATRTISRQTHTLGQTDVPGNPKYFLRWNESVAGAGGALNRLTQRMEEVRTLAGKECTLTFYAKFGSADTLPGITVRQSFGSGGAPSAAVDTTVATNVAVGTTWQKVQYVFTLPSISGKTLGTNNNSWVGINIELPLNTTFILDVSRVSLVEGDASAEVDPFSARSLQQELELCERYFEKSFILDTAPAQNVGAGTGETVFPATVAGAVAGMSTEIRFRTRKWGTPSITLYNPAAANAEVRNETDGADHSASAASAITSSNFYVAHTGAAGTAVGERCGIHWTAAAEF